jgi:hypothetical protein
MNIFLILLAVLIAVLNVGLIVGLNVWYGRYLRGLSTLTPQERTEIEEEDRYDRMAW